MEEKFPKNLQELIGQLDRAVPPVTSPGHANTNNGIKPDTEPSQDTATMVNAARRLAHGPKPALPDSALNRIEMQLRTHHVALHQNGQQQRPVKATPSSSRAAATRSRMRRGMWHATKRTLRYVAAVLLVFVMLTSGLTAASANSLPNDPLYTVKLGVEEIRLVLVSADGEPSLRITFAGRRLDEFEALLERQIIYPQVLEEAAAQMNRALTLLAAGHGNRQELDAKLADLTYQQGMLIQNAARIAPPFDMAAIHSGGPPG